MKPTFRGWGTTGLLLLALWLRLLWLHDPGFTHDVSFFVNWMRLAAQHGIGLVFALAPSSYPPLSVGLLWLLGIFASAGTLTGSASSVELLALRLAIITFDLLLIAFLLRVGRQKTGRNLGMWAGLLYALCPGGIYLSGWWVQIDAWFVLPMTLAAWWLAHGRVGRAWLALSLAVMLKLQAMLVLPIFVLGTWRWFGWRRLLLGLAVMLFVVGLILVPFVLSGQTSYLLPKMTYALDYFEWVTLETHNLWFAISPRGRDLGSDFYRDLHAVACGISYRDAGLVLLALAYSLLLARLFLRSGPQMAPAACALAWVIFYTLPTRIDARYLFPALPLLLLAGFRHRRWWIFYSVGAVTLLLNLVWKSRAISPLFAVLPITLPAAVLNAWVNVLLLVLMLVLYMAPLLVVPVHQAAVEGALRAVHYGWERALLAVAVVLLLGTVTVGLWRGRAVGAQIALLQAPLETSMAAALDASSTAGAAIVVNWPRAIRAGRSGPLPITPPALFLHTPESADVTWLQYTPWQSSGEFEIAYTGDYVTTDELAALVQETGQLIAFHSPHVAMVRLAEQQAALPPSACRIDLSGEVCLYHPQVIRQASWMQIDLTWQLTGTLPASVTVFVHVIGADGALFVQADGDPLWGLLPLSAFNAATAWREIRLVAAPADDVLVRVGLYDRDTGQRLALVCAPPYTCGADAVEMRPAIRAPIGNEP